MSFRTRTLPHLLFPALPIALVFCTVAQQPAAHTKPTQAATTETTIPGKLFTAEQLADLLPATVYFQGKSAPIQLRNAAGVTFPGNAILWVALVDSSGYSTSIQERYQFYLVTEGPLEVGGKRLSAGAYGGGFLADHFLLMDIGGHPVAEGPLEANAALPRPRPLQLQPDTPSSVKLYLGRHWVTLRAVAH